MTRPFSALIASIAVVTLFLTAQPSSAQGFGRQGFGPFSQQRPGIGSGLSRPTVSPYLSLSGRNPAINYFDIVRPDIEFRTVLNQQQTTIGQLKREIDETRTGDQASLPKTGHRAGFVNYSHFYPRAR